MKKALFIVMMCISYQISATNYYWFNGSGSWSDVAGHWSLSPSTFSVAGVVPSATDDVFFGSYSNSSGLSFTVTCSNGANKCQNMVWNSGVVTGTNTVLFTDAGGVNAFLEIRGSLTMQSGMLWKVGSVRFTSTLTGQTITSNSVTMGTSGVAYPLPGVYINAGGLYTFTDNYNTTMKFYLQQGALNTNSNLVTMGEFYGGATPNTTLTLGSSTVTITGPTTFGSPAYSYSTTGSVLNQTNACLKFTYPSVGNTFVYTAPTHTYTSFISNNQYFYLNGNGVTVKNINATGVSYYSAATIQTITVNGSINITGSCSIGSCTVTNLATISGTNTINSMLIGGDGTIGGANIFGSLTLSAQKEYKFTSATTQTITTALTATNTSCSQATIISASTEGSPTIAVTNAIVSDITSTGQSLPVTGFDNGGNTNVVFTAIAPTNLYWIGGSGNWSDPQHWSTSSSGGIAYPNMGGCVPSPADNVFFNSFSSSTNFTVTLLDGNSYCHDMTWNGAFSTGTLSPVLTDNGLSPPSGFATLNIYGSSTLQSGMKYNVKLTLYSSSNLGETITSNGVSMDYSGSWNNRVPDYRTILSVYGYANGIVIKGGGSYTFTDDFLAGNAFFLHKGSLSTNNRTMTAAGFCNSGTTLATTLTLGTSTVNLTALAFNLSGSQPNAWYYIGANAVLSGSLSTINVLNNYYMYTYTNHAHNNINFTNTTGRGLLTLGTGSTANRAIFNNDIYISGVGTINWATIFGDGELQSTSYGTLECTGSKNYTFGSATTTTIKNRWTLSTTPCAPVSIIKSSTSGTQATINFSATATATLTGIDITDMKATGLYTPTVTGSDGGNNTGFVINSSAPKTLYWVGGTQNGGLWNDKDHWSTINDGVYPSGVNGCVPSPSDDVIFGALSNTVTNTSYTVTIDVSTPAYCRSMTWNGAPGTPLLTNAAGDDTPISIYGSLRLQSGMSFSVSTVNFKSKLMTETIETNGVFLGKHLTYYGFGSRGIIFNSGGYQLVDGLNTDNFIQLKSGALSVNSKPFSVGTLNGAITLPNTYTLSLGTTTVNITTFYEGTNFIAWRYNGTGATLINSNNASINFTGPQCNMLPGSNQTFNNIRFNSTINSSAIAGINAVGSVNININNITFEADGKLLGGAISANTMLFKQKATITANAVIDSVTTIGNAVVSGTNTINYLALYSNGAINGANVMNTLVLNSGSTYTLEAAKTQTVTTKLYASGAPCARTTILSSTASQANLRVLGGSVNFDYGDIKSINATSLTLNYGGHSTNNGGNTNIVFAPTSTVGLTGLGPNLLLACNQYPYVLNTLGFSDNPLTTYTWTGGVTTPTYGVNAPGTYTVLAQFIPGCVATGSIVLTRTTGLPVSVSVSNSLVCSGTPAVLTATGVTTYTWSNGATTNATTVNPLVSTMYTVTGTDSNGCPDTKTITVNTLPNPTVTIASVSNYSICNGGTTIITPSGANTYTLLNTGLTGTAFTVAPTSTTTYSIIGESTQNCISTTANLVSITVNALPSVASITTSSVSCFGESTGSATIVPTGGTPGYTYRWSPSVSSTTNSATGLAVGNYTATVRDANLCAATQSFVITQPASGISISSLSSSSVSCFGGSTGSATVLATGGAAGYAYSWTPGISSTTNTALGLLAGNYTATVKDANNCVATKTVVVTQPSAALSVLSSNSSSVSCFGGSTGSATVVPTGGTPGYTYSWSPSISSTTNNATGLVLGNYTVTVRDANLCSVTQSFVITQPANAVSISSLNSSSVSCFGGSTGSATILATGGTPGYTYSWIGSSSTTNTATGLTAGSYTATVRDVNLCTVTQSIVIIEASSILTSITATTQASCGLSDGSVSVNVFGGTPAYTYTWAPPSPSSSFTTSIASTNSLAAGVTQLYIRDANSCISNLFITISNPNAPVITPTQTNVLCYGNLTGVAQVSITGGTGSYSYSWSPSVGTNTNIATNLASGNYILSVADAANCTAGYVFSITQPTAPLNANTVITNSILCYGDITGSATTTITGGTPSYTISWEGNTSTTTSASTYAAGNYTYQVVDDNGCITSNSFTISQPTAVLSVMATQSNVLCYGNSTGSVNITPSGGTPGYSYTWTASSSTTNTATGLIAGDYTTTVTDNNGCSVTQTITITEPSLLVANIVNSAPASCGLSNGQATVNVTGGTPVHTYSWTTPLATYTANTVYTNSLSAGMNQVVVTDINGCQTNTSLVITNLNGPTVTTSVTNITCYGDATGSITTSITGTSTYIYIWSNGSFAANLTNIPAGNYSLTVQDNNNCITAATVTQPISPVSLQITTVTPVNCFGTSTGSVQVIAIGGASGYTYNWQPGNVTTANLSNVPVGDYTLTATDNIGCATRSVIVINSTATDSVVVRLTSAVDPSCEKPDGSISVDVTGGTPQYSYLWNPVNGSTPTLTNLEAGNYTVLVTDNNGCTDALIVSIRCKIDLFIPQLFSPNGDGKNDKFEIITISNYPNNTLSVFNRWGSLVYTKHHYANEWGGKANCGDAMGSALLPGGVYYVVLDFGDGKTEPYHGFVQLEY